MSVDAVRRGRGVRRRRGRRVDVRRVRGQRSADGQTGPDVRERVERSGTRSDGHVRRAADTAQVCKTPGRVRVAVPVRRLQIVTTGRTEDQERVRRGPVRRPYRAGQRRDRHVIPVHPL